MLNTSQIKIGYIKSPARKGDRITVYFANGKSSRFVASNDLTSTNVVVMGDRAFSQDAAQQKLAITTRLFKSKNNYDGSVKYPFLSVFINDKNQLVSTYNGSQKILGDLSFSQFYAVNLNYTGNSIFTGTALSLDKSKVIYFTNNKIESVKDIIVPVTSRYSNSNWLAGLILSGNKVYRKIDSLFSDFNLSVQTYPTIDNYIDSAPVNLARNYTDGIGNTLPAGFRYNTSNSYTYNDNRTVIDPQSLGYSKVKIYWDYEHSGDNIEYFDFFSNAPNSASINETDSGTVSSSVNSGIEHTWDAVEEFPVIFEDSTPPSTVKIIKKGAASFNSNQANSFSVNTLSQGSAITPGTRYSSVNIRVTGTDTLIQTRRENSIEHQIYPQVVNDHKIKETQKKQTTVSGFDFRRDTEVVNRSIYVGQTSFVTFLSNDYRSSDDVIIIPKFNVGDLGIFIESKRQFVQEIVDSSQGINGTSTSYSNLLGSPAPSLYHNSLNIITVNGDSFNTGVRSESSYTTTFDYNLDLDLYKIAYLNKPEVTATSGFASSCTISESIRISAFFADNTSNPNLTVSLSYNQQLNIFSRRTRVVSNGSGTPTVYTRVPILEEDARGYDLNDQLVVIEQTYQQVIYLALAKVKSQVFTDDNNGSNSGLFDYRRVTQVSCEILAVKKIKSFFTTSSFIFTVDGCAIFQYLDPYKTNLITVENDDSDPDVYLAATVPTNSPLNYKPVVTEKDTQALLFKLTETGFTFVAVVGGDISDPSQETSPDAAYWIKYWERPVTSYW